MIEIPTTPTYHARRITDQPQCCVCGKVVKQPRYWIHMWDGLYAVMEDEIPGLDPMGDTGHYPIGADCRRRHPELETYIVEMR